MTWCRAIPGTSARTTYQRSPRTSSFSRATGWPPDVERTTTPVESCTERPADSIETLDRVFYVQVGVAYPGPVGRRRFVVAHRQESGGAMLFPLELVPDANECDRPDLLKVLAGNTLGPSIHDDGDPVRVMLEQTHLQGGLQDAICLAHRGSGSPGLRV